MGMGGDGHGHGYPISGSDMHSFNFAHVALKGKREGRET